MKVNFSFDWHPVLSATNEPYFFPNPITGFMKATYKHPAIYRWNIYAETLSDQKKIYIGEGQQLCPQRIKGYLEPGPSQETNKRINGELKSYIARGLKVQLEILGFDQVNMENFILKPNDLDNKHFRRFIEYLLITYYQQSGFVLVNR